MVHVWVTEVEKLSPNSLTSRERSQSTQMAMYSELKRNIELGVSPAGARLPTERALAELYGVSRKLVRQVLDRLTNEGLIDRRVGSGTFVRGGELAPRPSWLVAPPGCSPLDAIEARRVLEVGVAELVVARASDGDFARMQEALEVMHKVDDPSGFRAAAFAFTLEVVKAARNPLLTAMYEMLIAARAQSGWDKLAFLVQPRERQRARRSSEEFLDLLRRRTSKAAGEQRYREYSTMIAQIMSHPAE